MFTGHMIDLPDRAEPRFPAWLEDAAGRAIKKRIERRQKGDPSVEVASPCCSLRETDRRCVELVVDIAIH
jgi:hypothetical protein